MIFQIGDLDHSEMFPYAIKLVKELGAKKIYIEPHVHGSKLTPDIIGEISKNQFLIVECDAHQTTCRNHIKQFREDRVLRRYARICFILRDGTDKPSIKSMIRDNFGENSFYTLDKLKERYGVLGLENLIK